MDLHLYADNANSKGRKFYHLSCPRDMWAKSQGQHVPVVGTMVTMLASTSTASAGKVWVCQEPSKKRNGWRLVPLGGGVPPPA